MQEVIRATGHHNVSADHTSTFEVTTDDFLTPAGDCILAIEADCAPSSFDEAFIQACQDHDANITATIEVDGRNQSLTGCGHPDLTFASDRSAVARTSEYIDDRTVMVSADHAASGFDDDVVSALADGAELTLTLDVE